MKIFLSLILLTIITTTISANDNWHTQQAPAGGDCVVQAKNEFARVRSSWNLEADEIARIGATDTARYVARGRNASAGFTWYYIGIGWVRSDVVNVTGDCDNLTVLFVESDTTFNSDLYPCPANFSGYLAPRLASGQTAIHVNDHGSAYFVYSLPETSASVVGFIPNNGVIDRIGIGPLCHNGAVFWEVDAGSLSGFVIESSRDTNQYYLTTTSTTVDPTPSPDDSQSPNPTSAPILHTPYKIFEGSPATTLLFSPDSQWIAGLNDPAENVILWNISTNAYNRLTFPNAIITGQFGADADQFITVDQTGRVTTWSISAQAITQDAQVTLPENAESFSLATFSPEGSRVALTSCVEPIEDGCNRSVIVIADVSTGATMNQVSLSGEVDLLTLSPFGNALAVSDGDSVILWLDVVNAPQSSRTVPTYNIIHATALTFIPSGTRLLVAGCQETRIQAGEEGLSCSFSTFGAWTVDDNIIETLRGNVFEGTINGLSVTGDNETFLTHITNINSYQLVNGTHIRTYTQANMTFASAVFSPDGNTIAGADGEGKIMLWQR